MAALLLAALTTLARPAAGCTCHLSVPSPEVLVGRMDSADRALMGRVTSWRDTTVDLQRTGLGMVTGPVRAFDLQVERTWKGDSTARRVLVVTPRSTVGCGFPFSIGGRYIVFALADSSGPLLTTLCMGSVPMGSGDAPQELHWSVVMDSLVIAGRRIMPR